jgi:hypothetical protein
MSVHEGGVAIMILRVGVVVVFTVGVAAVVVQDAMVRRTEKEVRSKQ